MIRKIAVVAAALSLLLTGAAEAGEVLYPPEPPTKVVKVVKTAPSKVAARQKGALPKTGADSLPLTQIGAGLLAVGAVLVLIERNRRAARTEHVDLS